MPFIPAMVRVTVMTDLLPQTPYLKLRDTDTVLTFNFPKHDPNGPNKKSDSKFDLSPDCKVSPEVRTFDGFKQITGRYWDVKVLGAIDSNDALIALKLRACDLMKDLGSSNGELKNEAQKFHEAIVMRKRLQLQFRFGEHVKPSVLVDFDHQIAAR